MNRHKQPIRIAPLVVALALAGCTQTLSWKDAGLLGGQLSGSVAPAQEPSPTEAIPTAPQPIEDQVLTLAMEGLEDEDGLGPLSYQWEAELADGVWQLLEAEISAGIVPSQALVGQRLRVVVSYVDGAGYEEVLISEPTRPVINANDMPRNVPGLLGNARQHQALYFDPTGLVDDDGLGPMQWQWEVSGDGVQWRPVAGATANVLRLTQELAGQMVRATLTYVDGFGTAESVVIGPSALIEDVDDPVEGSPKIVGVAQKGEVLTAEVSGISDLDGIADLRIMWEASTDGMVWRDVQSPDPMRVVLDQSLVNLVLRLRVIVTDRLGHATTLLSAITAPVENVNSAPSGVIRILQVGDG